MNNQTENNPLEEKKSTVIIYCKEWCDYLQKLVQLLQKKDYAFTFIDLRFDTQKAKELVSKLGNPLILPVIYFNNKHYERPALLEVTQVIDLKQWRQRIDRTNYGKKPSRAH